MDAGERALDNALEEAPEGSNDSLGGGTAGDAAVLVPDKTDTGVEATFAVISAFKIFFEGGLAASVRTLSEHLRCLRGGKEGESATEATKMMMITKNHLATPIDPPTRTCS